MSCSCHRRPVTFDLVIFQLLAPYYMKIGPSVFRRKIVELVPFPKIRRLKEIVDTMDRHSRLLYKEKKQALEKGDEEVTHQIAEGKDILSVMSTCISTSPCHNVVYAILFSSGKYELVRR